MQIADICGQVGNSFDADVYKIVGKVLYHHNLIFYLRVDPIVNTGEFFFFGGFLLLTLLSNAEAKPWPTTPPLDHQRRSCHCIRSSCTSVLYVLLVGLVLLWFA